MFRKGRSTETECRLAVARSWGKGRNGRTPKVMGFLLGVIKMSGNEMGWLHNTVTIPKKKKKITELYTLKMTTMVSFSSIQILCQFKRKVEGRACW